MPEQEEVVDFTADGVKFAEWPTGVENDELEFVSLDYSAERHLTAKFFSEQKQLDVRFEFSDVDVFRLLDEGGLIELWAQSSKTPRPASTTFLVRGHRWQSESPLVWVHGSSEPYFSFMIATDWDCLEVVSGEQPVVNIG